MIITRERRQQMTDDDLLTVILGEGRPMNPLLYNELTRRGLHNRFAKLERSVIGREPFRLQ